MTEIINKLAMLDTDEARILLSLGNIFSRADNCRFILNGTNFSFRINSLIGKYHDAVHSSWFYGWYPVTFEKVFEHASQEAKRLLFFHLDIFNVAPVKYSLCGTAISINSFYFWQEINMGPIPYSWLKKPEKYFTSPNPIIPPQKLKFSIKNKILDSHDRKNKIRNH